MHAFTRGGPRIEKGGIHFWTHPGELIHNRDQNGEKLPHLPFLACFSTFLNVCQAGLLWPWPESTLVRSDRTTVFYIVRVWCARRLPMKSCLAGRSCTCCGTLLIPTTDTAYLLIKWWRTPTEIVNPQCNLMITKKSSRIQTISVQQNS